MPLRQSLSPNQKFAVICACISVLIASEIALLFWFSRNSVPSPKAPTPTTLHSFNSQSSPVVPTPAPLLFSAPPVVPAQPPANPRRGEAAPAASGTARVAPNSAGAASPLPSARTSSVNDARAQKAAQAFERGTQALQAKNPKAALAAFREVVALAPDHFPTRLNLALLYENVNDPRNAQIHLLVAARLQPKNAAVRFSLARAQLALGQTQAGLVSLRETVRLAPRERASRALLAEVLASGRRPTRARLREAYALWSALAREDKRDVNAHLQAAALSHDALGQTREAIRWLRPAIQNSPRDPRPSLLLAQLLTAQKQPKEAARVLATAAKNRPDVFEIYGPLAQARLASGDSQGAISALRAGLQRLPKGKDAREKAAVESIEGGLRLGLGRILGETRQTRAALAEFQKAARLLPKSGEPDALGALALIQLKQIAPAAQSLERALARDPKRDGDRRLLAQVYGDLKQWQKADAQWQIYTRNQPKDAQALLIWSQVAAQSRDTKKQIQIAQKLVQVVPKDPVAWTQLGILQKKKGDKRAALAAFNQLKKLQPDNVDAAYERAILQNQLGNSGGEWDEWKIVVRTRPDYIEGYQKLLASAQKSERMGPTRDFLVNQLAKKPENLAALAEIMKFHEKSDGVAEAKAFLTALIMRDPSQKSAKTILASFENR